MKKLFNYKGLQAAILAAIFCFTTVGCNNSSEEIEKEEVFEALSEHELNHINEVSKAFGTGLVGSMAENYDSEAHSFHIGENMSKIEEGALQYMETQFPSISAGYFDVGYEVNQSLAGLRANESDEAGFTFDESLLSEAHKGYLDRIGSLLVPTIAAYDATYGEIVDFGAFQEFYLQEIGNVITEIDQDEELSGEVKESLILVAYMEVNTAEAQMLLVLDQMGLLTDEIIEDSATTNGRTNGLFKKVWKAITGAVKKVADPVINNIACYAKVIGSHLAVGAAAGWAFGGQLKGSEQDFLQNTFAWMSRPLAAVLGGAVGAAHGGYKAATKGC